MDAPDAPAPTPMAGSGDTCWRSTSNSPIFCLPDRSCPSRGLRCCVRHLLTHFWDCCFAPRVIGGGSDPAQGLVPWPQRHLRHHTILFWWAPSACVDPFVGGLLVPFVQASSCRTSCCNSPQGFQLCLHGHQKLPAPFLCLPAVGGGRW